MTIDDPSADNPNAFLLGAFTASYPGVTYTGSAGAFVDRNTWSLTLIPSTNRQCPVPITTTSGTTVLTLTSTGSRMTGDATLVECEGRTTWAAEFVRR